VVAVSLLDKKCYPYYGYTFEKIGIVLANLLIFIK